MKKRTARFAGIALFTAMLASAGGVLAMQSQGLLLPGVILVCLLFVICMGMLFAAEAEEDTASVNSEEARKRKLRGPGGA